MILNSRVKKDYTQLKQNKKGKRIAKGYMQLWCIIANIKSNFLKEIILANKFASLQIKISYYSIIAILINRYYIYKHIKKCYYKKYE